MARPNRGVRLERNDRGVYEIRWSEEGRSKRVSTGATDAGEAADALRVWKGQLKREAEHAGAGTVRGLLDAYFTEHVYPKVVSQGTAETARKHLLRHFADQHPADIHPTDVRGYTAARRAGAIGTASKDATIRRELGVLVAALHHAVNEKRMKLNDVPPIPLPEASAPRERWLHDHEVERLVAAAAARREGERLSRVERFLGLAYYTAARKRAIEELEWNQVDWEGGMIRLEKAGRRKTNKRRPTVPIHPRLRAMLEQAFDERKAGCAYVLDHSGNIRKAFATLVLATGLAGVTPHVMRHTAATHMLRRKVPLWQVAGILGDTEATVQRTYGHHVPDALAEAVGVLS